MDGWIEAMTPGPMYPDRGAARPAGHGRRAFLSTLTAGAALTAAGCAGPGAGPSTGVRDDRGTRGGIAPAGQRLASRLDGMNVEALWLPGYPIDWRTGQITGPIQTTPGGHTHCSAFAAAAADRLGLYLLRPPEHGQNWLANAQEQWLNGAPGGRVPAHDAGWRRIGALADQGSSDRAIARANGGHLVVAIYFQPPSGTRQRPGHIAIVRPSEKAPSRVQAEGPDVIQAGGHNHRLVALREGFASHRAGWTNGTIEYFWNQAVA